RAELHGTEPDVAERVDGRAEPGNPQLRRRDGEIGIDEPERAARVEHDGAAVQARPEDEVIATPEEGAGVAELGRHAEGQGLRPRIVDRAVGRRGARVAGAGGTGNRVVALIEEDELVAEGGRHGARPREAVVVETQLVPELWRAGVAAALELARVAVH